MKNQVNYHIKKGLFWNSLAQFTSQGISLLSVIILGRLLNPEDFGILGMFFIFIAIAGMIVDSGMGSSILKKVNATVMDYSTLFIYNLAISAIIYLILYLIAPVIAKYYDKTVLIMLIRVIGLVIIIHALSIVQNIRILKNLKFKALAIISCISGLLSLVIAIILAKKGYGVWALVMQQIVGATIKTLLLLLYNKFIPSFTFSIVAFKEQFSFGINLLLSNLIRTITENINANVIAKTVSLVQTGYFVQSNKLATTGNNILITIIDKTIFPIYAKIEKKEEITQEYVKFGKYIYTVIFPISMLFALTSHQIICIVLGNQWNQASWMFRILSFTFIPLIVQTLCRNLLKSRAKTKQIFKNEIIKSVLLVSFLFIGMILGLKYILWSIVISQSFACLYMMYTVSKEIDYQYKYQLKDVSIILAVNILSYFCVNFLFEYCIQNKNPFFNLLTGTMLMSIFVLFFSYLFRQKEFFMILKYISYRFKYSK